ncbi:MAG: class I SAM-dependent methyltransferase [Elusimicrobia bacterium]|nr:class I SAM-dependent methyltransferase [Elusimicrobiota bacterium]
MTAAPPRCPACGSEQARAIGIRGTREHFGADPLTEPHTVCDVLRCGSCDLIYAHPLVPEMFALEVAHYSDPATYRAREEGGEAAMFARRLELIETYVQSGTLLDVGAGKGEFLEVATRRGWRAVGVEPSPGLAAYAGSSGAVVHQGTLDEVAALHGATFDVVTLNHVLEHVDRPRALLEAVRERLRPGGVVYVEVPNCDAMLLRLADAYFRARGLRWSSRLSPFHAPFHRYGYTKRSLRASLRACGFEVARARTFSGRDRGHRLHRSVVARLRDVAATLLDLFGERELLAVIARAA